jgi:hypothetical protein
MVKGKGEQGLGIQGGGAGVWGTCKWAKRVGSQGGGMWKGEQGLGIAGGAGTEWWAKKVGSKGGSMA